jgi:putative ABC transport system permease protein
VLPLAARALLRLTDPAVREFIEGDLSEVFDERTAGGGGRDAHRWAVRQAFQAVLTSPWRPRRASGFPTGDGFMKTLLQDFRYGFRMIRKQPGYSLVIVLTLALAIGANSVIFSFASILAIRPLPLANENALGWIFTVDPQTGDARSGMSIPEFLDYRSSVTSFSALAATVRDNVTMTGRGDAERLEASRVTANIVDVWGLRLQQGRGFRSGADRPGADGEVLLSNHFWTKRLDRDPSIVGQTLMLDGRPATVVGILSPEIEIGNISEVDIWLPLQLTSEGSRLERRLRVSGLLRPGTSAAQASPEARQIATRLASEHPDTNAGWSARVAPTREAMVGTDTFTVLALLGTVVGFVLLIACANLANMVLSRGIRRRREIAVRSALGASRGRVVRQMLTENVLYGIAGGLVGLAFAQAGLAIIRAISYEPFFELLSIDRHVLIFTTALAFLTPLLFGLFPALQSSRADVNETLKEGGARSGGGVRTKRSRSALVIAQLGLAVALLVVTGLLVKALMIIERSPVGFDTQKILTFQVSPPAWRYRTDASTTQYYDQLLSKVRSAPGVEAAGLSDRLPLLGSEVTTVAAIDGIPAGRPEDRPWAVPLTVDDGYFAALGVPIQEGRGFTAVDTPSSEPVAVINHEMARRFWPASSQVIGAHVTVGAGAAARRVRIVGMTADVLKADREGVNPQIFQLVRQVPRRDLVVVVRATDPRGVQGAVRGQVRALDADVPVYMMRPLEQAIDEDLSSTNILFGLFGSFAIIALVMAASGLYAVVSYSAGQRIQEFGVRIALGAVPRDIQWMMLRQTGVLVCVGLALGLLGGRVVASLASSLLYRVSPSDPAIYTGVAATLGTIALLASYGPVRRACRIDPVRALRLE